MPISYVFLFFIVTVSCYYVLIYVMCYVISAAIAPRKHYVSRLFFSITLALSSPE